MTEENEDIFGEVFKETKRDTIAKLTDKMENFIEPAKRILENWNSGRNMQKCKSSVSQIAVILNKLSKSISIKEVEKAVSHYKDILDDDKYFFSYKWGLKVFLINNKYENFLDDGEHWVNYSKRKLQCGCLKDWDYHVPDNREAFLNGTFDEHIKEKSDKIVAEKIKLFSNPNSQRL